MKEKIVNLFMFVNGGIIRKIGAVWYDKGGSDETKILFLQSRVNDDWRGARRHKLLDSIMMVRDGKEERGAISYDAYVQLAGTGKQMEVLESVFMHYPFAPRDPLLVITPIVDGQVRIEAVVGPPN